MNTTKHSPRIIILGNNITALAIVRGAHKHGLRPVLFDKKPGIAFSSALTEKIICSTIDDYSIVERLDLIERKQNCYLISAGDEWLHFIIRNRKWLDIHFKKVLHADNNTLTKCIDKSEFASWCKIQGLASPRYFDSTTISLGVDISFPVILRPVDSSSLTSAAVPKAVHIEDRDTLEEWQKRFQQVDVDYVVTESLLHHRLTKYSVAVARSGKRMTSYVAKQVRPQPDECAVGTYVTLSQNYEVEMLARRVAELLDYYGMGEIEILYSHDTRQCYLIEFNARPWAQYSLAEDSNHSLLKFLINGDAYFAEAEIKTGKNWIWFNNDLHVCFSRSVGYIKKGRISWSEYFLSLMATNSRAIFNWKDPWPALFSLRDFSMSVIRNRFRKKKPSA